MQPELFIVTARSRTLIYVEFIFAIIALLCGTMAFTSLIKYAVLSISLGTPAPWNWTWVITVLVLLAITVYAFRKIDHAPIRVLVVILLFVPQIVYLLLDQTIPFPEVWFLNT